MYQEFITSLEEICQQKGVALQYLGPVGATHLPFCVLVLEPAQYQQTVCFSAGIHGDETAGSLAILEYLKKVELARLDTRVIIFPVANPTGYEQGTRRNHLQRDLNRHFDDQDLIGEKKFMFDFLQTHPIDVLHTLHEDSNQSAFYLYTYGDKPLPIHLAILRLARKFFAIQKAAFIYKDRNQNGIIFAQSDGSFEARMHHEGVPLILCTETPAKMELKKRVKLTVQLMENTIGFTSHAKEH